MENNNNANQQDDNYSKEIAETVSDSSAAEEEEHIEQKQQQEQQQIVPVLEEDYSISKETSIKEAKIEKRAVTKTKSVKVPITYEELYINGKKLKSVEEPRILSALKDKITSIASRSNSDTSVDQSISKKDKIESRGELVPLFSSSSDDGSSETQSESEKEKIIPLYKEEFEIIKKVVKVAEIVITKRRITEKKTIDIDLRGEQVKIKYPDRRS
jgi:stress response protein YsnF